MGNVHLSAADFLVSFHLYVSVTIGSAFGTVAIHMTEFVVLFFWWVTVILLFVTPEITFKLQNEKETQNRLRALWEWG